jgi:hypothetical protein
MTLRQGGSDAIIAVCCIYGARGKLVQLRLEDLCLAVVVLYVRMRMSFPPSASSIGNLHNTLALPGSIQPERRDVMTEKTWNPARGRACASPFLSYD